MRTSAPSALASSSVPLRAGDAHHVAEAGEDHARAACAIAMPSSTRPIGITQTGQPGPCTSSTFSGSRSSIAVLVDRVRVAAADLHHLVVAARLDQREDLGRERAAELGVAELVDELHARRPRQRGAGVHEQLVARRTSPTSAISTGLLVRRRPRSARGRRPRPPRTRIATASSPQVMHPMV